MASKISTGEFTISFFASTIKVHRMMQWKSHYFTTEKIVPTLLTFKDPILYKIWILWNIQNFLIGRNLLKSINKRFNIYLPNIDARRKELRESPIPYKWLSKNFDLADCYESWFRSKIFVRVATKMSPKSSHGGITAIIRVFSFV